MNLVDTEPVFVCVWFFNGWSLQMYVSRFHGDVFQLFVHVWTEYMLRFLSGGDIGDFAGKAQKARMNSGEENDNGRTQWKAGDLVRRSRKAQQ